MTLPRRHFLRGSGALLAVPLLESLLPKHARAAPVVAPRRLVFFIQDNGTLRDEWAPAGGPGSNFALPYVLDPLTPYREYLNVVAGIDNHITYNHAGNAHDIGNGTLLTGIARTDYQSIQEAPNGGGVSLDQFVSAQLPKTPRSSININMPGGTFSISYAGAQQPVTGLSFWSAFEELFGNLGGTTDPKVLARRKLTRESVIDAVLDNFKQVNQRVSAADKLKLDRHLSVLRDLELRLSLEAQGAACAPVKGNMMARSQYAASLYSMAMACQLSHVGVYGSFSPEADPAYPEDFSGGYHTWIHQGPDYGLDPVGRREHWRTAMRWWSSSFGSFLEAFKATTDVDGRPMLDNTLLVWLNVFGMGSYHDFYEMPVVLAGKAGGGLQTGRYLDYRRARASHPTPYYGGQTFVNETTNNLHVSICKAMGLSVSTFGDPAFCTGGLPGLV